MYILYIRLYIYIACVGQRVRGYRHTVMLWNDAGAHFLDLPRFRVEPGVRGKWRWPVSHWTVERKSREMGSHFPQVLFSHLGTITTMQVCMAEPKMRRAEARGRREPLGRRRRTAARVGRPMTLATVENSAVSGDGRGRSL